MLTRALYLTAIWFTISLLFTLWFGTRLRRGNFLLSSLWLLIVILAGDGLAYLTFGVPYEMGFLSALAFFLGLFWILLLPDWNALGHASWTMTLLITLIFVLYTFRITSFTPLSPLAYIVAFIFYVIETSALLLALTHSFESLDVACRFRWHRRFGPPKPAPYYIPKVSLHVPTYNEPFEVVEQTLLALARLDYPNFEVLVIDNNTPEEATWRQLRTLTWQLGSRFHFLHLDQWPGYKSGALNFGLAQTAPDAEIIATIDADYQLDPNFLKDLVPVFRDPKVAFVQTPQDYRDIHASRFANAIYHGYKYFFDVSMPARNESDAIIFAGTMGLIRKSALQEIGGWDERIITEDAEASLRMLERGYQSIYIHKTYGHGLMPYNFDGLKKQRFRWCFGGIQILRTHWEELMPWAHLVNPDNRLTFSQRYYYLVGGLQWFTDVFNLLFAFFLILGALLSMTSSHFTIRPLTGPLLVLPSVFIFINLWRFLWVLHDLMHLTWRKSLQTMYSFFSLSWVVALACLQGLVQNEGVFLRTPKSQSHSRTWRAFLAAEWEVMVGGLCVLAAIGAFIIHPALPTLYLAVMLTWQGSLYLSAPYFSLLSVEGPDRLPGVVKERGQGIVEVRAARLALSIALLLVVAGVASELLPTPALPHYAQFLPREVPLTHLLGINRFPWGQYIHLPVQIPFPLPHKIPFPTTLPHIP